MGLNVDILSGIRDIEPQLPSPAQAGDSRRAALIALVAALALISLTRAHAAPWLAARYSDCLRGTGLFIEGGTLYTGFGPGG